MYIHALDQKATETAKEEEEPRVFALHRSAPPLDFHRHFLPFHHCKDWILTRILTLSLGSPYRTFYQGRLTRKRQAEMDKRSRERMENPNFFPSVPKGLP